MNSMNLSKTDFCNIYKKYKRGYLSLSIQGDTETPISLFKKLYNGKGCFLLESVENGKEWGRFSHIGRNPFMELICRGEDIHLFQGNQTTSIHGNPMATLKDVLDRFQLPKPLHTTGFFGGAVGHICYDMARHNNGIYFEKEDEIGNPDVHLLFPQEVISYDHQMQSIIITVHTTNETDEETAYKNALKKLADIEKELSQNVSNNSKQINHYHTSSKINSSETKASFMKKVEKIKDHIYEGDIFQAVPSQRFSIDTQIPPFEAYRELRIINPSPYMYFMDFGDYTIVGSSPEMLTKIENGVVTTCPIAGTRPRGKTLEEDLYLEKNLLEDEKEVAEHLMLVDLARNDIGSVSEFGSVHLTEYMNVRRYSHVMHIVSLVHGKLNKNTHMLDGLLACLPAGTVSGAPKRKAMQIIDALEERKRGIYAGAIGWFGFDGNMDTCIAIRTIIFKDQKAFIQAGAGIVADSVPESEYDETLRKAHALFETIERIGGKYS